MKGLGFRICVLGSIAVVLLPFPRSEASSYCPGCEAGVIGAAIGVGAGIGTGIYFIHRSHTSLTGCVREAEGGLSATAKDGNTYQLVNAPSQVKAGERFSLRATKSPQLPGVPSGWTASPETTVRAVHKSQRNDERTMKGDP